MVCVFDEDGIAVVEPLPPSDRAVIREQKFAIKSSDQYFLHFDEQRLQLIQLMN
jgi:hypothetical protein